MKFWDSSAIVPLLIQETATAALTSLLRKDREMIVWWSSEIECASALARREREECLTSAGMGTALKRLDELLGSCVEIQPSDSIRQIAKRLLRVHPLRAADSLQLAAAILAAEGRPASLEIVTLDERLAEAADREGFAVSSG